MSKCPLEKKCFDNKPLSNFSHLTQLIEWMVTERSFDRVRLATKFIRAAPGFTHQDIQPTYKRKVESHRTISNKADMRQADMALTPHKLAALASLYSSSS